METTPDSNSSKAKRAWGLIAAWIGGITAVLGFVGAITGAFHSIANYLHQDSRLDAKIAVARQQASQGEYSAALQTYAAILQTDPGYKPAQQAQLATTEEWVRDFHVPETDGHDTKSPAAASLDQIFPVLDSAAAQTQGQAAAGIQAHLGWAHWLNRHIAMREFDSTAEQDMRSGLKLDSSNVYANAMLGNWLLVNHHSLTEALQHFSTAEATGKERPFVRRYELGALVFDDEPGARAAVMKIADDMRRNHEPLTGDRKRDALVFCCDTSMSSHDELAESLAAVPQDDAMQTYIWLSDGTVSEPQLQSLQREFIQAVITELHGDRATAFKQLKAVQANLHTVPGTTLDEQVEDELKRVSK